MFQHEIIRFHVDMRGVCAHRFPMTKPTGAAAVERAVNIAGTQLALACAIGVKQGQIWAWLNLRPIPPQHCMAVEVATNGQVTVAELRPDLAVIFSNTNESHQGGAGENAGKDKEWG